MKGPGDALAQARDERGVILVVPCFNEEARFDQAAFEQFFEASSGVDIILVNDGSTDGTWGVLESLRAKHPPRVRTLDLRVNQGKAEAVRQGMLLAMQDPRVAYAGFWDADLATPLDEVDAFIAAFRRQPDVDIILGARVGLLGRRINRRSSRHYFGRIFATAASVVLSLPVYDTQCGAKLFRNNPACRALFSTPFGSRWIFDVELMARYLSGRNDKAGVYELPLDNWTDVGESKVHATDFIRAIGEMVAIHRKYRLPGPWRLPLDIVTQPFLRYLSSGLIGTAIHYGALVTLVEFAKLSPTVAATVGASLGALANYFLNYHLTFASKRAHRVTVPRFFAVAALGVALNALVIKTVTGFYPGHYLLAQACGSGLVLGIGFIINRLWTFGDRPPASSGTGSTLPER
jgi:dolichyl-phosphate beta-glucosyltransferase